MIKDLSKKFSIKKSDIISITGSGGKTTLMESLGEELKNYGRVLITSSSKIRRPQNEHIDYIFDSFSSYRKVEEDKVLVAMGELDKKTNKFYAISQEQIESIRDDFDYIIIEADGCRNLPLKMWKSHEPVIYSISSKVICVFSAKVIGRKVEEDFIYNYEDFNKLIEREYVDKEVFLKLIRSKPGPFGDFVGDRYVFFNQVESIEEKMDSDKVITYLRDKTEGIEFLSGSLLSKL